MDIDTTTDGKDDGNTSNSVENLNGYNVFTDEYYDNVDRVTLLEHNEVTNSFDAVYSGSYIDDTYNSYMTVMNSSQANIVRNDYNMHEKTVQISPIIWILLGAGLTLAVILLVDKLKKYAERRNRWK